MNNKNNVVWKALTVIIIPTMLFMGKGIIENDRASRQRDTDIRREAVEQERRTNENLEEIKTTQNTKFTEILVVLERLRIKMGENSE